MKTRFLAAALLGLVAVAAPATTSGAQSGRMRDEQAGPAPSGSAQEAEEAVPTLEMRADPPAVAPAPTENAPARDRTVAPSPEAVVIAWKKTLPEATKQAKRGQIIVVDVYTSWCGWCKVMDREVYAHPTVVAFASRHQFVKVNAEDGGAGQALAKQHGVHAFPTTLVFSADGRLLEKRSGAFQRPGDFLSWLGGYAKRG